LHEPRPRGKRNDDRSALILGGRYRLEHELSPGGTARVYRGMDTVLGRTVAIKVLAPELADDANFVRRSRAPACPAN